MGIILRQAFCRWLLTRTDENQTQSIPGSSGKIWIRNGIFDILSLANHQRALCNVLNMSVMAIRGA